MLNRLTRLINGDSSIITKHSMMRPDGEQWWVLVEVRHILSACLTALFRCIALLLPSGTAVVSCAVLCAVAAVE